MTMRNELGDARRSQIVTTHGPGSIIDFRAGSLGGAGVSVVAAGLEEWDRWAAPPGLGHPQTVFEPRLQKQLGVEGFRLPPVAPQIAPGVYSNSAGKLVGVRFPQWLQCPKCHIIGLSRRWHQDAGDPALYCGACSQSAGGRNRVHVVPVRFIVLCERGHLDEFPWHWWVKHSDSCKRKSDLRLEGSAAAGLNGLILTCTDCGRRRSMEGCFGLDALPQKCAGRRPWLGADADENGCPAQPRVVQRGASNIYFSVVDSALDIPPWSDQLQKKIGVRWSMLEQAEDSGARSSLARAMKLPELTGLPEEQLLLEIEDRIRRLESPERNLRWEEYQQFTAHNDAFGQNSEFEIHPEIVPTELSSWVKRIVRTTRLREVRAIRGFTRVFPPVSEDDDRIANISLEPKNWLPAVENRGEGIFVELNLTSLKLWESSRPVKSRMERLQREYHRAWLEQGRQGKPVREITPRLLLVHSLAHALIRQLALSCGYGSASLRERLYIDSGDWEMAGFLIYTSSPDADGTLGGLARQGETENINGVFQDALAGMVWCASDPLCLEGIHALSAPANGAACHACLLSAETSCEEFNVFMDRALLVGTPSEPALGYFANYVSEL